MRRRRFLQEMGGLSVLDAVSTGRHIFPKTAVSPFQQVTPSVLIYRASVNVGLVRRNGKLLLINSGDASVLRAAKETGIGTIDWALYTSHERPQCSGASLLQKAGVKIAVPEGQVELFRDATRFWQNADSIINHRYDFRPDLSMLRSSVMPDRVLRPGEVFTWNGLEVHLIPTPGTTDGAVSYVVVVDGKRVAFTGDLIYGPGKMWQFWKLQKPFPGMVGSGDYGTSGHGGYWAFGGAVPELKRSLLKIISLRPDLLIPAHGSLMESPAEAVALLTENLDAAMKNYLTLTSWRVFHRRRKETVDTGYPNVPMLPPQPTPAAPSWLHRVEIPPTLDRVPTSWYIQAPNGRIFLFDCGYYPVVPALYHLLESGQIKGIDGVWITHYHDDHVASVNRIAKDYRAKVYAQQELVDILEHPLAYRMPCLFPERIHVDHPLTEGETFEWNGYRMTGHYFPGQTLYHDALLVEHEGARIFMSGDSFSNLGIDDYCIYNRNFLGGHEPGYQQCIRLLLKLKPDMLIAAHFGPVPFAQADLEKALAMLEERRDLFANLFPWEDPNFGLDPDWVRAYPLRQNVLPGQLVKIEARIFNHSSSIREASADLRAPSSWRVGEGAKVAIPPHTEGTVSLTARASATPQTRRDVLGVAVTFDGINLGEAAVAIIDYLS